MNIPEGWKLVPVEPTVEMITAAFAGKIEDQSVTGQIRRRQAMIENYRAMLAAAPTPPAKLRKLVKPHVDEIRAIAVNCGFKLKPQPDGLEDLNPYVYKFARELLATIPSAESVLALRERLTPPAQTIPMILHCPVCGMQHIDAPDGEWTNPPHRSHLCHRCGHIWRPADVTTVGVAAIRTKGERDSAPPARENEPVAYQYQNAYSDVWIYCSKEHYLKRKGVEGYATRILYTRSDNSGLRKAAEEVIDRFYNGKCDGELEESVINLRAELNKGEA